jgi:HD-like signal output (HDOD) protein
MPLLPLAFRQTLTLFAAEGDEVSVAKLAVVIEQDAVLTGNLIAIANSVFYGRTGTVCSLRQAIARIGIHKTRNALLGFSVLRSFRTIRLPPTWSLARFNDHSLATATFSDLLVQKVNAKDAEWAFLSGLLHDIGLLLVATGLPEEARAISEVESDYQLVEQERQVLGFTHFEIGVALLSRWGCPAIVQDASLFCQNNSFQYESPLNLGMVVKTASVLADASGMSMFGSRGDEDVTFGPHLLDAISVPTPATFIDTFQAEYAGLAEFAHG